MRTSNIYFLKALHKLKVYRFILTGLTNTTFTYGLYVLLNLLHIHYLLSYFIGFIAALIITTYMNFKYTFTKKITFRKTSYYITYLIIYWLISSAIISYFIEITNLHKNLAPLLTVAILLGPHFLVSKKIIN